MPVIYKIYGRKIEAGDRDRGERSYSSNQESLYLYLYSLSLLSFSSLLLRPILQRFGQMHGQDGRVASQVGNGTADFEDAMKGTRT